jgi:hypothetical protein
LAFCLTRTAASKPEFSPFFHVFGNFGRIGDRTSLKERSNTVYELVVMAKLFQQIEVASGFPLPEVD